MNSLYGFFETKSVLSCETERHNVEMKNCLREAHYFNELESKLIELSHNICNNDSNIILAQY